MLMNNDIPSRDGKKWRKIMISIIGDTSDELATLQSIIDAGMVNSNERFTLDVTYKLSSGDNLLVNQYKHIVGSKPKKDENW